MRHLSSLLEIHQAGGLERENVTLIMEFSDFPGAQVVKNPPTNAEDADLIPRQGTKIPQLLSHHAIIRVHAPQHKISQLRHDVADK